MTRESFRFLLSWNGGLFVGENEADESEQEEDYDR